MFSATLRSNIRTNYPDQFIIADAKRGGGRRSRDLHVAAAELDGSAGDPVRPDDGPGHFGAASPHKPGEAQDFTGVQVEAHVVQQ